MEIEGRTAVSATGRLRRRTSPALFEAGFPAGGRTRKRSGRVEEIPFLTRQQRLVFARCGVTDPLSLDDYRAEGGLKGLERAIGLGADATSTTSWPPACGVAAARASRPASSGARSRDAKADQKYVVCNADEGDSGTFADRMLIEGDPFLVIEGMAIAALAVGATKGYVYIRSEYPHAFEAFSRAIERARASGLLGRQRPRLRQCVRIEAAARRRRLCLRRGNLDAREHRGQAGPGSRQAAAAGDLGPVREADRHQQHAELRLGLPGYSPTAPRPMRSMGLGGRSARSRSSSPETSSAAAWSSSPSGRRSASSSRISAAARARAGRSARCRSAARSAPISRESCSTRRSTTRRCWRPGHARPRRDCRLRRHRRHGQTGALRVRFLRQGKLRQVHALPPRLDPRRRDGRQDRRRPGPRKTTSNCCAISAKS